MIRQSMTKVVFLVYLVWGAASALGCDCAPLSLIEAKAAAEVIFRGTITDIRRGKVSFRVDRVWKGNDIYPPVAQPRPIPW